MSIPSDEPQTSIPTAADYGEQRLIELIRSYAPSNLNGDDAAVLAPASFASRTVVSTDVLVDGRHFRLDWMTAHDVGRRAVVQNFADIEAMGARPVALLLGLGLPPHTPIAVVEGIAAGLAAESGRWAAQLVGGDIVRSDVLTLSVTAVGELAGPDPALTLDAAHPGQSVILSGDLGAAAAGLALLDRYGSREAAIAAAREFAGVDVGGAGCGDALTAGAGCGGALTAGAAGADLGRAGTVPGFAEGGAAGVNVSSAVEMVTELMDTFAVPHLDRARGMVARSTGATSMTDVSDGLVVDLGRLAARSGVAIDLEATALEPSGALVLAGAMLGEDPLRWVLTGGESHALVGTTGAPVPSGFRRLGRVYRASLGTSVTIDGEVPPYSGGWESI